MRTDDGYTKKESNLWARFVHWLLFDLTPVLLLLVVMAWGMSLVAARTTSGEKRSSAPAPWSIQAD